MLGRTFGLKLIHRYGRYLRITEEHVEKAHAWFERVGHWGLTFGYFVPGVRHLTAYAAGMSELECRTSSRLFAYSGAVLWVSTFLRWDTSWASDGRRWSRISTVTCSVGYGRGGYSAAGYLAWRKWLRAQRK